MAQTSVLFPSNIILTLAKPVKTNGKENLLSSMWSERDSNSNTGFVDYPLGHHGLINWSVIQQTKTQTIIKFQTFDEH